MSDDKTIKRLEARIRMLEDREEIRSLRDSYHAAINDGRYSDIAKLFTEDAYVKLGYLSQSRGKAEIEATFQGMGEERPIFYKADDS